MTASMSRQSAEILDFNLIRYLVVIMETRSMVRASEIIGVTPAAVSYAVSKLRTYYNDPLFIRSINGVKPTALAVNLYEKFRPINKAMLSVSDSSDIHKGISQPERKLIIRTESISELCITRKTIDAGIVPQECTIEFTLPNLEVDSRVSKLRNHEVDIDIGFALTGDRNIIAREMYGIDFALVCQHNHPRIGDSISYDQFIKEKYISLSPRLYNMAIFVDLENIIYSRQMEPVVESASLLNMLMTVANYDFLMIFPRVFIPLVNHIIPIREVSNDFINKRTVYFYGHLHKRNENDELINKVINACMVK